MLIPRKKGKHLAINLLGKDVVQLERKGWYHAAIIYATRCSEKCKTEAHIFIAPHRQGIGAAEVSWSCTGTAQDKWHQVKAAVQSCHPAGPASPHAFFCTGIAGNALLSLQGEMKVASSEFLSSAYHQTSHTI